MTSLLRSFGLVESGSVFEVALEVIAIATAVFAIVEVSKNLFGAAAKMESIVGAALDGEARADSPRAVTAAFSATFGCAANILSGSLSFAACVQCDRAFYLGYSFLPSALLFGLALLVIVAARFFGASASFGKRRIGALALFLCFFAGWMLGFLFCYLFISKELPDAVFYCCVLSYLLLLSFAVILSRRIRSFGKTLVLDKGFLVRDSAPSVISVCLFMACSLFLWKGVAGVLEIPISGPLDNLPNSEGVVFYDETFLPIGLVYYDESAAIKEYVDFDYWNNYPQVVVGVLRGTVPECYFYSYDGRRAVVVHANLKPSISRVVTGLDDFSAKPLFEPKGVTDIYNKDGSQLVRRIVMDKEKAGYWAEYEVDYSAHSVRSTSFNPEGQEITPPESDATMEYEQLSKEGRGWVRMLAPAGGS